MEQNTVKFKSKVFAKNIIFLYQKILAEKREYVLSKQLLRCGTSIGANLAESECAISTNDFLSKVYISLKEASVKFNIKYEVSLLNCLSLILSKRGNSVAGTSHVIMSLSPDLSIIKIMDSSGVV